MIEQDKKLAFAFIEALTGNGNTPMHWRVIDDKKTGDKDPALFIGTINDLFGKLCAKNNNGYGVFLSVNEVTGKEINDNNITRVRAVFIDDDDAQKLTFDVEPAVVTHSANGIHAYWLVNDCAKSDFTRAQRSLAVRFNTDRVINNPSRIMRVPGFLHQKGEPKLVDCEILNTTDKHDVKNLIVSLGASWSDGVRDIPTPEVIQAASEKVTPKQKYNKCRAHVLSMPMAVSGAGGNGKTFAAMCLGGDYGLNMLEFFEIAKEYNSTRCTPPWSEHELAEIMKNAYSYRKLPDGWRLAWDKIKTPDELANELIADHNLIVSPTGNAYMYVGNRWAPVSNSYIDSVATLADEPQASTIRRRQETVSLWKARVQRKDQILWNKLLPEEVPLKNGVLNLVTDVLRPHSPDDFVDRVIPVDYTDGAWWPTWFDALNKYFRDDAEGLEKIKALQEFFGYCLLPHARFKKCLVLYGPGNCGKSAIAEVMRKLVGTENCCAIGVWQMDDARELAPIRGKALNIIADLPSDALVKDGGFKKLVSSGNDPIDLNQKYLQKESYIPTAKHLLVCNSLPMINDTTAATHDRLLIIALKNVLTEMDRNIGDKFEAELPGILRWAIEGARRLIANDGVFTRLIESEAISDEHRFESNPVRMYLQDKYDIVQGGKCNYRFFVNHFNEWNNSSWSSSTVSKHLQNMGIQRRSVNSEYCVIGVQPRFAYTSGAASGDQPN